MTIDPDKYERCRDKYLGSYDQMDEWGIYEGDGYYYSEYWDNEYQEGDSND